MKFAETLRARLVISHLLVSIISIILMAAFAGRSIYQNAISEVEHSLQGLAFAAGNALELPIQELRAGRVEPDFIKDMLAQMFADSPDIGYTVFNPDGTPIADSNETLPPNATLTNAPEVIEALENDTGRGVSIRDNISGEEMIFLAVLVQREIEVTAILRLGLPMEPTKADARNSLAVLLLASLLIAFGVSLFGWILANNLARPIQGLRLAAEDMERGDLGVRVEPSGPYELHRLGEAFNKMARRLESNVNELRAFVANASHELRTPLTVVKLRAEALQDGALEDAQVSRKFLVEIEEEVDRLVRMVNDLLDLSRMEAEMHTIQQSLLNMSVITREVYETFKIRAENAKVKLVCTIKPDLPSVMGDEDQIRRVLYNLLENAINHTPRGGRVELILSNSPKNGAVRITVQDNGQGIAPEHLAHVFERFYRVEATSTGATRGSGLGLSIAKSIIEAHGGEIGVESELKSGTTFWADLPAAK